MQINKVFTLNRLISVLIFACFVSSCAILPKESNGTGMLLIAVNSVKETTGDYFVNYRIVIREDKVTYVRPEDKYILIGDLAPGEHKIKYLEAMYKNSGRLWYDQGKNIPFSIKKNTITVLDKWLAIKLYKKDDLSYQEGDIKQMPKRDRDLFIEEFTEKNELGIWTIDSTQ